MFAFNHRRCRLVRGVGDCWPVPVVAEITGARRLLLTAHRARLAAGDARRHDLQLLVTGGAGPAAEQADTDSARSPNTKISNRRRERDTRVLQPGRR